MWSVILLLIDTLSWVVDSIGYSYTPAVLLIWCIMRFQGPTDRMHRFVITTNTLLLLVGIISCLDILISGVIDGVIGGQYTLATSSSYWCDHYTPVYWISRFLVIGLLPFVLLNRVKRASIKWSLVIVAVWFVWANAMDFLRHGYLCYCDARPLKTYALLLLTFAGIFAGAYWLLGRKDARGEVRNGLVEKRHK
jgi:hypothetical protein